MLALPSPLPFMMVKSLTSLSLHWCHHFFPCSLCSFPSSGFLLRCRSTYGSGRNALTGKVPCLCRAKPGSRRLPAVGLGISVPIACQPPAVLQRSQQVLLLPRRACRQTPSTSHGIAALGQERRQARSRDLLNMGQNLSPPPNVFRITLCSGAGRYCSTVKGNDQP